MMTEISLNILDVTNNSIHAGANLVEIIVRINNDKSDTLLIVIKDNGCGMSKETLSIVEDPFYTTRTTRPVGLGIPFLKQASLSTGGNFNIASSPGEGTTVTATFNTSHIDCMPLGDINSTIYTLINFNPQINFIYTYENDGNSFTLDTREVRAIIGEIPINSSEISEYIKTFLNENMKETDMLSSKY